MSMVYGGREGYAAVLTADEWVATWNRNHDEDWQVDDVCAAWEMDGAGDIWDEGTCCDFETATASELGIRDERLGNFGQAIDADPNAYNGACEIVATFFAPRQPDYFSAAYRDIDELVDDIIEGSEAFVAADHDFVRAHLAMVNIVSYG